MRSTRQLLVAALMAGGLPGAAMAQPTVFGPGTITKPGETVYRGRFSPDGQEFWFFRKVDPDAEDYRIWVARRSAGGWGEPERVRFGGEHSDLYPAPSPDGRVLVFTSYRPFPGDTGSHPNANLWYVERTADGWSDALPMRGASTPSNYDSGPWFSADGTLHFRSTWPDWRTTESRRIAPGARLDTASFERDPIIDRWASLGSGLHVWDGVTSPEGSLIVLGVSEVDSAGRRGPSDLWIARRRGSEWGDPVKLGPDINTADAHENFVAFTPDGRRMLFVRGFETYWEVAMEELLRGS